MTRWVPAANPGPFRSWRLPQSPPGFVTLLTPSTVTVTTVAVSVRQDTRPAETAPS